MWLEHAHGVFIKTTGLADNPISEENFIPMLEPEEQGSTFTNFLHHPHVLAQKSSVFDPISYSSEEILDRILIFQ